MNYKSALEALQEMFIEKMESFPILHKFINDNCEDLPGLQKASLHETVNKWARMMYALKGKPKNDVDA